MWPAGQVILIAILIKTLYERGLCELRSFYNARLFRTERTNKINVVFHSFKAKILTVVKKFWQAKKTFRKVIFIKKIRNRHVTWKMCEKHNSWIQWFQHFALKYCILFCHLYVSFPIVAITGTYIMRFNCQLEMLYVIWFRI